MPDRLALITALAVELPPLPAAANAQAEKALNKVIALFVTQLPLAHARRLTGRVAHDLRVALDDMLSYTELKKVSKKWDLRRTVAATTSQTELARELVELLDAARDPFDPTPRPLDDARALDHAARNALIDGLWRFATRTQLNAVLKKWDRRTSYPPNAPRQTVVQHLCALLDGTREPVRA